MKYPDWPGALKVGSIIALTEPSPELYTWVSTSYTVFSNIVTGTTLLPSASVLGEAV
jgi:hypothetical protein